jgi:DNA polymerase V
MIFHIDANSFYASCEQIFRPDLKGKPVAVLSNNDGITIALNRECKNLGFCRGDVYFKKCTEYREKGVHVFSSNYTLYADISNRLNLIYSSYCPETEPYSIDESFLFYPDWSNADFTELGFRILDTVWREVHIPISVGIAPTKTLAKLCNSLAKRHGGIYNWKETGSDGILAACPVSEIWGIGKSKAALLTEHGIKTAYDLKRFPLDKAQKYLSITGFRTVQELNGIPANAVQKPEARKNITVGRSFARCVTDIEELETALAEYTQTAVTRMRTEGSACRGIAVFLMAGSSANRGTDSAAYDNYASAEMPRMESFLPDILDSAVKLLRTIYRPSYSYRKIMICLSDLESARDIQQELFDTTAASGQNIKKAVMAACDRINEKYGSGTIHPCIRNQIKDIGESGRQSGWIMARKFLSPAYTTKLSDIPEVF